MMYNFLSVRLSVSMIFCLYYFQSVQFSVCLTLCLTDRLSVLLLYNYLYLTLCFLTFCLSEFISICPTESDRLFDCLGACLAGWLVGWVQSYLAACLSSC